MHFVWTICIVSLFGLGVWIRVKVLKLDYLSGRSSSESYSSWLVELEN